jgi:PAS domain S-box-containing protein
MLIGHQSTRFKKMLDFKHLEFRSNDRLGLAMIVASLVAITLTVATLLWNQKESREKHIRTQGVSLTTMISDLPYEQLVPAQGQQDLLRTIFQSQNDPSFVYAAIIDTENNLISVASARGLTVPQLDLPVDAVGWLSDRPVSTSDGESVIEFYTPLYADESIVAYLRLGYLQPVVGVSLEQVPFLATLGLIIFLLTPLFHFLVRKEVKPLREANEKITTIMESRQFQKIDLQVPAELSGFLDRFTAFVDLAKQRIENLESEQENLVTSKNLITYSKSRIENVLEAIPEAVLILDQSGSISFANRHISTLLGVSHDDVINNSPADWCVNEELFEFISRYSEPSTASRLSETTRLNVGEIKKRSLAIKAYPLFSPTDSTEIYGTLICIRDVTKESTSQRQQGEFVAHVAHELKTPLNTLSLYTEAIVNDDDDDPRNRIEAANIMHDEVERMAGLIDNLLSITKIEMGEISIERQRLRLHEFLEDTFDVASRTERAKKLKLKFELDLPTNLTSIMADKDLMRIAINNLLTNAVKYSRPGGEVSLRCEETEQSICIVVKDNGIGIVADEQDRIFERFYRSDDAEARKRSGHGLGLALARDIVQLHYGTLAVTSTPNEGSEFIIQIWKEVGMLKQVV